MVKEPMIRVPDDFEREFPDASALATDAFLNLGVLVGGVQIVGRGFLAEHGLTSMAAFNVLTVLEGSPVPLAPSVVAERMMVTRPTMTGLLDSLERRSLVRRVASPADARQRLATVTPAGRRLVRQILPELHRFERELMAGALDPAELRILLELTARLQHRLRELVPGTRLSLHE